MLNESIKEARRQIEICNACRYCEGYCSVFPAINRQREYSIADIGQLANLCHNCRGCYYACQYTEPHEFALNIPKVLAEVRQDNWQEHAFPARFACAFHKSGVAIAVFIIVCFSLLIFAARAFDLGEGGGFYAVVSHNAMVAIFMPAFILPLISIGISIARYWKSLGGETITISHVKEAFVSAAKMKNLAGGHGDGCNFEDEDRFSHARRWSHQAVMYGFLLCFAATSMATLMHYLLNIQAPYGFFSLPKLLGVSGGLLLSVGTIAMYLLKLKSDRKLSDVRVWGGETGFIVLLFLVSSSGLALYWLGASQWMDLLLAFHLGAVLAFFLLMPFSKMVHGFFRLQALIREAQITSQSL